MEGARDGAYFCGLWLVGGHWRAWILAGLAESHALPDWYEAEGVVLASDMCPSREAGDGSVRCDAIVADWIHPAGAGRDFIGGSAGHLRCEGGAWLLIRPAELRTLPEWSASEGAAVLSSVQCASVGERFTTLGCSLAESSVLRECMGGEEGIAVFAGVLCVSAEDCS